MKILSLLTRTLGLYASGPKVQNQNVTDTGLAIENTFGPVLAVEEPACKQAISQAGQDPAVQQCYYLIQSIQGGDVPAAGANITTAPTTAGSATESAAATPTANGTESASGTIDAWLAPFCTSGCNEQLATLFGTLLEQCTVKTVLGPMFSENQTASIMQKYADVVFGTTCLVDNATGRYCLGVVLDSFQANDTYFQSYVDGQWTESSVIANEIVCSTDCGRQLIDQTQNVTGITASAACSGHGTGHVTETPSSSAATPTGTPTELSVTGTPTWAPTSETDTATGEPTIVPETTLNEPSSIPWSVVF